MKISDRKLHRLLALISFFLFSIYLIRIASKKDSLKLKVENTIPSAREINPITLLSKTPNLDDESQLKVSTDRQSESPLKVSTDRQSTIKDGLPPAEVFLIK
jgi:hypothetical protein